MDKQSKKSIKNSSNMEKTNNNEDIYGYDFVPTLSHVLNIDEQRENVKKLENINDEA